MHPYNQTIFLKSYETEKKLVYNKQIITRVAPNLRQFGCASSHSDSHWTVAELLTCIEMFYRRVTGDKILAVKASLHKRLIKGQEKGGKYFQHLLK